MRRLLYSCYPIKTHIQYHQISAQIFSIPATCSRCIQML